MGSTAGRRIDQLVNTERIGYIDRMVNTPHVPGLGASARARQEAETRLRSSSRSPLASPAEVAREPAPFPAKDADANDESFFPDWRRRLSRNLARRSDGRWDPLTCTHAANRPLALLPNAAGGTMDRTIGPRSGSRGVILVASRSASFADIVGGMVSDSGFAPACWAASEPAWLSITRTQPCLVICDCEAPRSDVQRLLSEASVRGVPVLLSRSPSGNDFEPVLSVGQRVGWLTFPSTRDTFQATLDQLMPTVRPTIFRRTGGLMGVRVVAAVGLRTLSMASHDRAPAPGDAPRGLLVAADHGVDVGVDADNG